MAPLGNFVAVKVRIAGLVQNVWFRAWTEEQARRRGLKGWVRNCSDGSVEAQFAGPKDKVDDMVKACHRGPERAKVSGVEVEPGEGTELADFRQLPTL
jgi:acylphosphatase